MGDIRTTMSILDPRNWSLPVATRVMSVFEGALVALTPDGDRVLTRDRDYTVRVWRTADLEGTVAFEPMNADGMGALPGRHRRPQSAGQRRSRAAVDGEPELTALNPITPVTVHPRRRAARSLTGP